MTNLSERVMEKKASCASHPVSIFMAGDVEVARQICREYCDEVGFCVTVTATTYVYTGGQEDGSMPRGLKRATLKDYVIKRCQELGLNPSDDNQADALGILDHALSGRGIIPPWRQSNILTAELGR